MEGGNLRIDAHVHLVGFDEKRHGNFLSEKKRHGAMTKLLRRVLRAGEHASDVELDLAYVDRLARLVEEARFLDKALIFALDGVYDERGWLDPRTDVIVSNDWAMEAVRRHPHLFLLGVSIHPNRPDALEELERCAAAGAVCVKWVPPSQNIDPSEQRYLKFYERMGELGLALSSHTGYEHTIRVIDQSLGDPFKLRLPLEVGLKVVAGHCGTSGWIHRVEYFPHFASMVRQFDNLYGDTAAITALLRGVYRRRILTDEVVRERIIQGTDYPVPLQPVTWLLDLGWRESVKLQFVKNPFDQDYLAKKGVGFPEAHFLRGEQVFIR